MGGLYLWTTAVCCVSLKLPVPRRVYVTSRNDISVMREGDAQYNVFTTERGTIIDDFVVYRTKDSFLCVVNASNKNKDLNWLRANTSGSTEIIDDSDETTLLSLQGPASAKIMEAVAGGEVLALSYMHFGSFMIAGFPCMISRTGYTGEDGFEIYTEAKYVSLLWDIIVAKGAQWSMGLAGLGARDILRIEAGYCLYGNELDETTTPLEAALDWIVKADKKDFLGKKQLLASLKEGVQRKRVGFIMEEKAVPRKGYLICSYEEEQPIGTVSSGTYSPNLDQYIGMGYISANFSVAQTPLKIKIREKLYKAKVIELPFVPYRHSGMVGASVNK
jgi:aminomethyltransferase